MDCEGELRRHPVYQQSLKSKSTYSEKDVAQLATFLAQASCLPQYPPEWLARFTSVHSLIVDEDLSKVPYPSKLLLLCGQLQLRKEPLQPGMFHMVQKKLSGRVTVHGLALSWRLSDFELLEEHKDQDFGEEFAFLQKTKVFAKCSRLTLMQFFFQSKIRTYGKNKPVCLEGAPLLYFYLIREGDVVAVKSPGLKLYSLSKDQAFGLSEMAAGHDCHPETILTTSKSTIYHFGRTVFQALQTLFQPQLKKLCLAHLPFQQSQAEARIRIKDLTALSQRTSRATSLPRIQPLADSRFREFEKQSRKLERLKEWRGPTSNQGLKDLFRVVMLSESRRKQTHS